MDPEECNRLVWTEYGQHHLRRGTPVPLPQGVSWAPGVEARGAEVLGDVAGRRVCDIGSGTGRFAAHLARAHDAMVDAVDNSPTQHQRALEHFGDVPGVRFVLADAVDHLRQVARPYDVVYSVHGFTYIDPQRLLLALSGAVRPGGRLVFSVLHTSTSGAGASETVTPRTEDLALVGGGILQVQMWVLSPALWQDLLSQHGFRIDQIDTLDSQGADQPVSNRLIRARRRP